MNDEKLTLYYYNDGLSNAERQEVANALATDPAIAARYQKISSELGSLSALPVESPPRDMVERWHAGLDRVIDQETQAAARPPIHTWSFLLGAAITAALAVGIGIGFFIADDDPVVPVMQELVADEDTLSPDASTAFLRGLQVHLRQSEEGIATLPGAADRSRLIMDIIEQNRLFERAAEQNDSANLARVLRAFELVLVQLAAEDITPEDAEELRAKLLFELNVMLTKLAQAPSDEPQTI